MNSINIAVLRGTVSSEPRRRELPSGDTITHLEITTRTERFTDTSTGGSSVPAG